MKEFSGVDSIRTFFGGRPKNWMKTDVGQFTPKIKPFNPFNPFDSIDLHTTENWKKFNEYELSQANVRPVEASALELGHEIDRLKKEKNQAIKELNEHMEEYRKLDNDLRDAIREKRRLLDVDTMNVLLMKQNLELREQLEWME